MTDEPITIPATGNGFKSYDTYDTFLDVTFGDGNLGAFGDYTEVHLRIRSNDGHNEGQSWFRVSDLIDALKTEEFLVTDDSIREEAGVERLARVLATEEAQDHLYSDSWMGWPDSDDPEQMAESIEMSMEFARERAARYAAALFATAKTESCTTHYFQPAPAMSPIKGYGSSMCPHRCGHPDEPCWTVTEERSVTPWRVVSKDRTPPVTST